MTMKDAPRRSDISSTESPEFESIAGEVLLRSLEQSSGPLTARQIRDRLTGPYKLPLPGIEQLLERQVATGKAFAYPGTGTTGKTRYWTQGIEELARDLILKRLGDRSLTLPDLIRGLRSALRGLDEKSQRQLVSRMVRSGDLHEWPPVLGSRTARYSVLPPQPDFYLSDAFDRIARRLALSRQSLAESWRQFGAGAGSGLAADPTEPDNRLLERMIQVKLAAAQGAPLPLRELWHSLRSEGWEKSNFDRIVLDLAANYRVALLKHDFPGLMSPSDRSELVVDAQGNHYVGIALR